MVDPGMSSFRSPHWRAALCTAAAALCLALLGSCSSAEPRLRNIRQLTFTGDNGEAYFSHAGDALIFQSTRDGYPCDQMYIMDVSGDRLVRVSTGSGRTTCGYFLFPGDERILYSSTHLDSPDCPPPPDRSQGYVWPLHASYEIFTARPDGTDLRRITENDSYDAEGTVSPDGTRIVFTSLRDGDLDLYAMDTSGGDVRRLTNTPGYDGGPFYSWDGKRIVYRAARPEGAALEAYRALLAQGLVRPKGMEIFVMDADGSNQRQVTRNGATNFAPFFHPDNERIIFSSNMENPASGAFDLYLVLSDGTGLERITTDPSFDGFPMFSRDGKRLVWCSNRAAPDSGATHVFIAEWVP